MKFGITEKLHINKTILACIIIAVLLCLCFRIVKTNSMPPMEDVYFCAYDEWAEKEATIIYKYDAQTKSMNEIGRVEGYFFHCKIDSGKKYITGLRNASFYYDEEEDEIPGVEFGVVRFSLVDGTSDVILSDKEMHEIATGDIRWKNSFLCGDGEEVHLYYYDSVRLEGIHIIYNIKTKEEIRIIMPDDGWYIYDIKDDIVWYRKDSGRPIDSIIAYNMKTGERLITVQDRNREKSNCAIFDDGIKIAYMNDEANEIYLYEVDKNKEKLIAKSSWNSGFEWITFYPSGWDKSGNYYYIEFVDWIIGGSTRIKAYNVQTGMCKCLCSFPNDYSKYRFWEFIRNAD